MRPDAPLIKHMWHTMGPEAARVFNRLPLFTLPEETSKLLEHERELLTSVEDVIPLPFDDILMELGFGVAERFRRIEADNDLGRVWVRVRRASRVRRDAATCPQLDRLPSVRDPDHYLLVEGWEENAMSRRPQETPDSALIPLETDKINDLQAFWHLLRNPLCELKSRIRSDLWCNFKMCHRRDRAGVRVRANCMTPALYLATLSRYVLLGLVWVTQGHGGLLAEVSTPPPPPKGREAKAEKLKPWTAPRRRTFITIDPTRAGEYGHPSGREAATGSHASPIPHARRGHWRRVSEDKRIWIRPTWVGVREWQAEGRSYRVRIFE